MNEAQGQDEQPEPKGRPRRCFAELSATPAWRHVSALVTGTCFKQHQQKINCQ